MSNCDRQKKNCTYVCVYFEIFGVQSLFMQVCHFRKINTVNATTAGRSHPFPGAYYALFYLPVSQKLIPLSVSPSMSLAEQQIDQAEASRLLSLSLSLSLSPSLSLSLSLSLSKQLIDQTGASRLLSLSLSLSL